ncbi:MAG: hemolysin family protein [Pyrinomonadaceae bacterium]|jgi:putative hemolysin|nr:HlyC/CorC family transporter [Blastocatellia bacterium]MDQ3221718.1 hemolysin family protein [Acidobacteriota bacterium]MDQ3490683.1 hemolysin family protein [Acidobacteriota bacterium]
MEIEIVFSIIILIVLVFLATVDMAFSHLSDLSLRRLASETEEANQTRSTEFLREVLENRPRFRFALSSAIQILLISFSVLITLIVLEYGLSHAALLVIALLIGLVSTVIFRQVLPRLIIRNEPEKKLLFLLPIVRPLYAAATLISKPFSRVLRTKEQQKLDASVTPDAGEEKSDDNADDFQALMEVGEAEGIIEEGERELIESMVEFNDTLAGEIMTPRTEICALSIDASVIAARNLINEEKYSRLPVYRDSIDNIEGVIYVRDLLQAWEENKENEPIRGLLREAYFVPETKSVADLLKSMQVNRVQLAIVIDEYGGVAGIITVEDILEEIVGEIEDEDTEGEEIIEIIEGTDGYFDVLGSTEIDKIERLFDIEIEDEDFTTIAGLVTSEAGYIPKVGERLRLRGLDIEILHADDKKISLLRLRKDASDSDSSEYVTVA